MLPEGRRLSDYLNLEFNHQGESVTFLELNDVMISYPDGKRETADTIYVNREAIQMLRTHSPGAAKGNATRTIPYMFPYVRKSPVRAIIRMLDYELDGYVYCTSMQTIPQLLAEKLPFIPCIVSEIQNVHGDTVSKDSFIILNKKQVKSIHHKNEVAS